MLLTNFFVVAVFMMVIGPLVGAAGGAVGGLVVASPGSWRRAGIASVAAYTRAQGPEL
jgi:hypothetical protein